MGATGSPVREHTPGADANEANRHATAALFQCYWREIAQPYGLVTWLTTPTMSLEQTLDQGVKARVALPHIQRNLIATIDRRSLTGIFHIKQLAHETPAGPSPLVWGEFARMVVEELSLRLHRPLNTDLISQIDNSTEVMAWILSVMPARAIDLADPQSAYLQSEQSLAYGHPFHPTPKARGQITDEAWRLYAPEAAAAFQLDYFAVRRHLIIQDSSIHETTAQLLAADGPREMLDDQDWVLVPVHPWQARYLKTLTGVKQALQNGQLRALGAQGPTFSPTASVRTVYSRESQFFYKLSLSFRITNCLRRNALTELAAALQVNRIMSKLQPTLARYFPQFRYLEELAYLSLELPTAPASEQKAITDGFGLMLRRSLNPSHDTVPLLAAALFGNEERGRSLIQQLMLAAGLGDQPRQDAIMAWFSAYVHTLLPPLLYLYSQVGLMFEPHLQNIVISFRGGWPVAMHLRDFENARIVTERISSHLTEELSDLDRVELSYSETKAWKRFAYCLFSNHIVEAIRQLSYGRPELEPSLWQVVADTIRRYLSLYGESAALPMLQRLLAGEPLPAKTNLITRVIVGKDSEAGYVAIGNPWVDHVLPGSQIQSWSTEFSTLQSSSW